MFSLEFLDHQVSVAREKNNDFVFEHSSTGAMFSIQISMEEIELAVAEN